MGEVNFQKIKQLAVYLITTKIKEQIN